LDEEISRREFCWISSGEYVESQCGTSSANARHPGASSATPDSRGKIDHDSHVKKAKRPKGKEQRLGKRPGWH
jgi:hypothetical protein